MPVEARNDIFRTKIKPWGAPAPMPSLFKEGFLKTYPYNLRDEFSTVEETRTFDALVIENEHLRATVVPALGARLASLYDKQTGQEVFLMPSGIYPAPIVMRGAYFPMGIEFNVPIGHSIHSAEPVPCRFVAGKDGAQSIRMDVFNAVTRIHIVLWFELRPGERRLHTRAEFRNTLPVRNGFMYWANAAVHQTEGMFFQCKAPMCFFFVAYSPFPIVDGRNTLLARERDFPSDMFAVEATEPWFGFYQPEREFGAIHLSPPGEVIGKKLFSWSYDDYGMRWGRHYGCDVGWGVNGYVECQAGIPETQMEFSHLEPNETRIVHETWMPYHALGAVSHATDELIFSKEPGRLRVITTVPVTALNITVQSGGRSAETSLPPKRAGTIEELRVPPDFDPQEYRIRVVDVDGRVLLDHAVREAEPANAERIAKKQAWLDLKPMDDSSRREIAFRHYKQRLFSQSLAMLAEAGLASDRLRWEIDCVLHRADSFPQPMEADDPDHYARVAQADALAACGKWDAAAQVLRTDAERFPSSAILLAWIEAKSGTLKLPDSLPPFDPQDNPFTLSERRALESVLAQSPRHPVALHLLGNYLAGRNDDEGAKKCWHEVNHSYAGRWQAARNIGYTLVRQRQFEQAARYYEEATRLQPGIVSLRAEQLKVLTLLGRVDEALNEIENLPPALAADYRLRKLHAYLLRDARRFADSLCVLLEGDTVICWEGECGHHRCYLECHRALGLSSLRSGDFHSAKSHFDALLEYPEVLLHGKPKLENRAIGHYHLALWALAVGEKNIASEQLREAAGQPLPHAHHWISYRENEYFGALAARELGDTALERKIASRLTEFYFGDDYQGAEVELQSFYTPYAKPLAAARGFLLLGDFDRAERALRHGEMDHGPCWPLDQCREEIHKAKCTP